MNHWIFQGNPDKWNTDFDEFLIENSKFTWDVRREYLSDGGMKAGDEVFIWKSAGQGRTLSGIVAQGKLTGDPSGTKSEREVWIEVDRRFLGLGKILSRDDMRDDPVLSTMQILEMPRHTNYLITPDQARRINYLIAKKDRNSAAYAAATKILSRLQRRLRADDPVYREMETARDGVLTRYQPIFKRDRLNKLTREDLYSFLDFKNNKHWTGLHRSKATLASNTNRLRASLKILLDQKKPLELRIDRALNKAPGMGIGISTAILQIAHPDECGVWNAKSTKAMKLLGIWPKAERGQTQGQKYTVVNYLLLRLAGDLGTTLWNLDSLWHHYLEEHPDSDLKTIRQDLETMALEEEIPEGGTTQRIVNTHERNPKNVRRAKAVHGTRCKVCGFDFEATYGKHGKGYIEAHHLCPVSSLKKSTIVDVKTEMTVVCSNCHRMLHRDSAKMLTPEELRNILQKSR